MKNKLIKAYVFCKGYAQRWLKHFFDEQLGMRVLSILLAVVMWAAVMSRDDAVRFMTVSDLPVEILGADALAENELAIKQNLQELTEREVTIRLEGTKAALTSLNKDNLRVVVDLSKITTTGENQTVSLQVRNAAGLNVTAIAPYDALTVDVESLYSREIPVVAKLSGTLGEGYMVPSGNVIASPSKITVTGTQSDVMSISAAYVYVDVTDVTESVRVQQPVTLMDGNQNEIISSVELSDPTVIVSFPVYAKKTVPIEWRGSVQGEVADGFELIDAVVLPDEMEVAGYPAELEGVDKVFVSAISLDGRTESFHQDVHFVGQTGVKWMQYKEAQVILNIQEKQETKIVSEVPLHIINVPENYQALCETQTVTVAVTGPASFMGELSRGDFIAQLDLISATVGTNPMPVTFRIVGSDVPQLTFMQVSVEVTLAPIEE